MTNPLATQHCRALDGEAAMTSARIEQHLAMVPGWTLVDGAIQKQFKFDDYHRTMAFVNAVAWVAHREDHHPDLAVSYGSCTARFNTHSVNGISLNDFICAARLDALLS